jgi:hypothetical protein
LGGYWDDSVPRSLDVVMLEVATTAAATLQEGAAMRRMLDRARRMTVEENDKEQMAFILMLVLFGTYNRRIRYSAFWIHGRMAEGVKNGESMDDRIPIRKCV